MASFSELFKKYRLRSELETLGDFAQEMQDRGLQYEESIYSHWQRRTRPPRDRNLVICDILSSNTMQLESKPAPCSGVQIKDQWINKRNHVGVLHQSLRHVQVFQPPDGETLFPGGSHTRCPECTGYNILASGGDPFYFQRGGSLRSQMERILERDRLGILMDDQGPNVDNDYKLRLYDLIESGEIRISDKYQAHEYASYSMIANAFLILGKLFRKKV